jgi:hypothetical protein
MVHILPQVLRLFQSVLILVLPLPGKGIWCGGLTAVNDKRKSDNWQYLLKGRVPEENRSGGSEKKRVPGGGIVVSRGCILALTSVGPLS